jgi:rRNA processing protein Gar1
MEFTVLKATSTGNLLLKSDTGEPVAGRMRLFLGRKEACVVFETIGPVSDPLYLAEPKTEKPESLVGKTLTTKN